MKTFRSSLAILMLLAACGDDDGTDAGALDAGTTDAGTTDAGTTDAGATDAGATDAGATDAGATDAGAMDAAAPVCPDLMPVDPPELVISQIELATGRVEVFNPGATDVVVGDHAWCVRPAYPDLASTGPTTVPAGGYAVYTLPSGVTLAPAGGELALYSSGPFGNPANILDYVCWGAGKSGPNREMEARDGGHWTGPCAAVPTADAIVRRASTDGTSAESYDTTAAFAPTACE